MISRVSPLRRNMPVMRDPRWRVVFIGLSISAISLLLMPLPFLTGAKIGRFIVAFALLGLLIGASIALNGLIDFWRQR